MCVNSLFFSADQIPFLPSFEGQSCPADAVERRARAKRDLRAGLLNVVVKFKGEGGEKKVDPLKLTKIIGGQAEESWEIWESFGSWKLANRM